MTETSTRDPGTVKTATVKAEGVTEREIDGEQREVLRVPISSTRPDRENDRFDRDALADMAEQIRTQQPHVFDNHGLAGSFMEAIPYDSRETIGTQFDAEVEEADDGEADLFAYVNPDGTHDEGTRMLRQVRDEKQAIKFSVGFGIAESEAVEDEAGNEVGRRFLEADLMETSRVGIPANPDASAGVAAKGGPGGQVLPGFARHPLFAQMLSDDEQRAGEATAVKSPTPDAVDEEKPKCDSDGDCPDGEKCEDGHCVEADAESEDLAQQVAELSAAVGDLRAEVAALKEDDGDECSVDTDCPEGEVCLEGECVPEDEVDDSETPDEADATTPDDAGASDAELRERIADLEAEIRDGPGEPATDSTDTEEPDLTDDGGDPDATNDADPDETDDDSTGWLATN